jgi:hypothetical protein
MTFQLGNIHLGPIPADLRACLLTYLTMSLIEWRFSINLFRYPSLVGSICQS